jgi:hypothetical protein
MLGRACGNALDLYKTIRAIDMAELRSASVFQAEVLKLLFSIN